MTTYEFPTQICDFCQGDTLYAPLTAKGTGGASNVRTLRVHFCHTCQAEYVYWSNDGDRASLHLYTTINGKVYRWTTYPNRAAAFLSYVEEPGIPGLRPNQKIATLQKFCDHPLITPQNIEEKIRFMLPFL